MPTPSPASTRDDPAQRAPDAAQPVVDAISAVTLAVCDMARSVRYYRALGFAVHRGGEDAPFTCLRAGAAHLNLTIEGAGQPKAWWGRLIFRVADVDAFHRRVLANGVRADFEPRDAEWHERYFHVTDPDGHVLSFVHPIGVAIAGGSCAHGR